MNAYEALEAVRRIREEAALSGIDDATMHARIRRVIEQVTKLGSSEMAGELRLAMRILIDERHALEDAVANCSRV